MRIIALIIRIIRQFIRDKRTLALMLIAPMFILWLMTLVFNSNDFVPEIGVVDLPPPLVAQFEQGIADLEAMTLERAKDALVNGEIDAYISLVGQNINIELEGSDPNANRAVMMLLQSTQKNSNNLAVEPQITYLYGSEDMQTFDYIGPVLIGFFIFFFVFLIAGVSFLRERTKGTLERILSTPLKRWEIVVGYVLGFGLFTSFQAALISWFSIEVLGLMMIGSIGYVLLITLLLAMTALTLGILLSAFANNELQMIQFIPLVIVPQAFFSGLFSLETMSPWLQGLSSITPLKYGADALRDIMLRGKGWETIATDVYVLLGFSLAFMIANIFALRKHRRI